MTATMMTQIGTPSLLHIRASGIAVVTSYAHHRATSINTVHKNWSANCWRICNIL